MGNYISELPTIAQGPRMSSVFKEKFPPHLIPQSFSFTFAKIFLHILFHRSFSFTFAKTLRNLQEAFTKGIRTAEL